MKVSPFTPLFFVNRKAYGDESEYRQIFSTSDTIILEVLCKPEESPSAWINDECAGVRMRNISFNVWRMNSTLNVYYAQVNITTRGVYSIEIEGIGKCELFSVTNDVRELVDTVLIQYTMKDNRQRSDAVFLINNQLQLKFAFRVHGGFKDDGWSFTAESEQYLNEYGDTSQLYGFASTLQTLTMGQGEGVPVWYGELLNRLLACTYVHIDGVQYVRSENSVPEPTQVTDGRNSFVFRQTLRKAVNSYALGAEGLIYVRRIDGEEDYRVTEADEPRVTIY